ncbi:PREDICTED: uncharacterized protein LOC108765826 [Trachymyrmex cornetzi]|uniref:uncharacterized protein LOC108765826 n=1 Tax=Trachymyrmex cornetzi TaxID=471704 RepID=UPI00084EEA4E|nr:PREDICTED: uncharacterized protein LOC108765826 [Trachymyrmex cornetzi]
MGHPTRRPTGTPRSLRTAPRPPHDGARCCPWAASPPVTPSVQWAIVHEERPPTGASLVVNAWVQWVKKIDMAYRNVIQLHIVNQLENCLEYNERPRFQINDDLFQISEQFVKLFRLKKDTTIRLINIVEEHSAVPSRISALNVTVQVLTALRFYASDSYQNCVGSNVYMCISQTSVSRCIHNVINILNLPEVFNTYGPLALKPNAFPTTCYRMPTT